MNLNFKHISVLLEEVIDTLNIKSDGVYVDATAGGGGMSLEIAERLSEKGKLICIDQDPDAVKECTKKFRNFKNVYVVQSNFENVKEVLKNLHIYRIDGAILDLGVSSYQLDTAERGFSYKLDASLDMRMSKRGKSAFDFVNFEEENEIIRVLRIYGEEKFAKKIAKEIVFHREKEQIRTTSQLAEIIKNAVPQFARRNKHPAKKSFQAIRIAVNDELGVLERGLDTFFEVLNPQGVLAVITFHSLEDKLVKRKMLEFAKGCICPKDFPICVCGKASKAKIIHKKGITPTVNEVKENLRSRSARLRVCVKI